MIEKKFKAKWTTSDEIRFLAGLGGWMETHWNNRKPVSFNGLDQIKRLNLLAKYKKLMGLRKVWKDEHGTCIDPKELSRFLP